MPYPVSPQSQHAMDVCDQLRAAVAETRQEIADALEIAVADVTLDTDLGVWTSELARAIGRLEGAEAVVRACLAADATH